MMSRMASNDWILREGRPVCSRDGGCYSVNFQQVAMLERIYCTRGTEL